MKTTKLAQLLIIFRLEEWKAFQEFLELTDLNVRPKHRMVFAYIKDYFWKEKEEQKTQQLFPQRDLLQKHYFPKSGTDYLQLNKALSVLHLLLKQFLLLKYIAKDSHQLDLVSIEFTTDRQQFHYAQTALYKAQKKMSKKAYNGYELYLLSEEEDRLQYKQNHRKRMETLQKVSLTLDDFYFTSKLKNYCLQLNRVKATNAILPKNPSTFEAALTQYCSKKKELPTLLQIYYEAYQLLKGTNSTRSLKKLFSFITEYKLQMKKEDLRIIQDFIFNHYTMLSNVTEIEARITLGNYKKLLTEKILIDTNGNLQASYYRNIVVTAIKAKDHTYAEQFTQTYKNLIPIKDRDSAYYYNLSNNAYAQKKWREAIDNAIKIDANNPTFKFSRGSLLIRSSYEYELSIAREKDIEAKYSFEKMFSNFKAQLHRKQPKPSDQLKAYQNFVYFSNRLYKLYYKINPQYEYAFKLQKKITDTPLLAARPWLMEKLKHYAPLPTLPSH